MRLILSLLFCVCFMGAVGQSTSRYAIDDGHVAFTSDAPLELIQAESDELRGLIDFDKETFAFTIQITSFKGFNSALQREHFNENYMESERFPKATFTGKLLDKPDLTRNGEYKVSAKGKLTIHGVEQERTIPAVIQVASDRIQITSRFDVMLADHKITIPKVVLQKLTERVTVDIKATGIRK